MKKYRKKPVVIGAKQWFKAGDVPVVKELEDLIHPDDLCDVCKCPQHQHGYVETLEGGHIVCPGDWIIRGIKGEYYPCKPDIFKKTYEAVST